MAPVADPAVLIGIVKDRRDLALVARRRWYRIPVAHAPTRAFTYLAFYQPAVFGPHGGRIEWYAAVLGSRTVARRDLLPEESDHPRAADRYRRYDLGPVLRLPHPIRNLTPRRITFVFTTLRRLFAARELFGVFNAFPVESIMETALRRARLPLLREFTVALGASGRFRLDFAIFCERGAVAVECDAEAWHTRPAQRQRDAAKDAVLRRVGWNVVRLTEDAISRDVTGCVQRVRRIVRRLGGPAVRR